MLFPTQNPFIAAVPGATIGATPIDSTWSQPPPSLPPPPPPPPPSKLSALTAYSPSVLAPVPAVPTVPHPTFPPPTNTPWQPSSSAPEPYRGELPMPPSPMPSPALPVEPMTQTQEQYTVAWFARVPTWAKVAAVLAVGVIVGVAVSR